MLNLLTPLTLLNRHISRFRDLTLFWAKLRNLGNCQIGTCKLFLYNPVMIQAIAIHGRQPALGRAELESLYGADLLEPIGPAATGIDLDVRDIDFARLGGSVKLAKALTILDSTDFPSAIKHLTENLPKHLHYIPDGKIQLGISLYGIHASVRDINAAGLAIKKVIKAAGRSGRFIPNKDLTLNSAQVLHNHLTGPTGLELLLLKQGNKTILAQTKHEQDIEAYAARDQARPKRDAKVGMLPPKLAQIIINLAKPEDGATVLDPFCGTGVVLQEALLMGYNTYGTDLDERMVEYSKANLEWLNISASDQRVEPGDALQKTWNPPFTTIAAETYLGRPFSAEPESKVLQEVMQAVDTIHRKFLRNLANQTKPGFRACIAVPAWKTKNGFKHLEILDSLGEMGYTRMSFVHASNEDLIYHRENQIVARELVVLIRK